MKVKKTNIDHFFLKVISISVIKIEFFKISVDLIKSDGMSLNYLFVFNIRRKNVF